MKFSVVPSHKDLFKSICVNPNDLIKNYSSKEILGFLSFINAQLYLNDEDDPKFQKEFTLKIASFWLPKIKTLFLNTISNFYIPKKTDPNLFKTLYVSYFIENILKTYSPDVKKSLDSEGEFLVIKAYFAYIDKYNDEFTIPQGDDRLQHSDPLKFHKLSWPFFIKQFEFNEKPDPIFQSIQLHALLEYFYLEPKYNIYVRNYLSIHNRESIWNLILDLMELIKISFGKIEKYDINNFSIRGTPDFASILDNLSIDALEYSKNKNIQKDFLGMREKPLFKISTDVYIVMNWKFLYNSIYTGVLFDFKNKSGILELINFNTYKSLIGKNIAEEKLFKNILKYSFQNQYSTLHFGESNAKGEPDAYLRIGKFILIFEFKDYLFPTNVTVSNSFNSILDHINSNFVKSKDGKNKGINQLNNQIKKIIEGGFDFDLFESKEIKKRNIVILPIIITTHFTYQMPGINSYLSALLNELLVKDNVNGGCCQIYPLTMIDFAFLYRNILRLKKKELNLKDLIISYQSKISKYKKTHNKNHSSENAFKYHSSFEEHVPPSFPPQKENGFVPALFEALNINTELTSKK